MSDCVTMEANTVDTILTYPLKTSPKFPEPMRSCLVNNSSGSFV